jgi:hypothetical protein
LKIATDDVKRRNQAERQALAERVVVWAEHRRSGWHVRLVNLGGVPIYQLLIRFSGRSFKPFVILRPIQGPSSSRTSGNLTNAFVSILDRVDVRADDLTEQVDVEIAFTDATGSRWRRKTDGELTEVDGSYKFDEKAELDRSFPESTNRT